MGLDYLTIVDLLSLFSQAFSFPSLLGFALFGIIAAFFGYFIFMKALRVIVALEFGTVAYLAATSLLPAGMNSIAGLPISVAALVGIAFAIIGAIIAHRIYKLFVFATGASIGAGFAFTALYDPISNMLSEPLSDVVFYIAMAVCAIVFAIIITKAFRGLFILTTSLGGMCSVGATLGIMLCPDTFLYAFKEAMYSALIEMGASAYDVNQAFETVGLNTVQAPASDMGFLIIAAMTLVGFVVGIIAAVKQFKTEVD